MRRAASVSATGTTAGCFPPAGSMASASLRERQLGLLGLARRRGRGGIGGIAAEPRRQREPQVLVGGPGGLAAAGGAADEAFLHQEWLVDVLQRPDVLAQHHGQRLEPDRSAVVALDQR